MVCYLARRIGSCADVTVTLQLQVCIATIPRRTAVERSGSDGRLSGVQAARGVAALMVVLYHATRALSLPQYLGYIPFDNAFGFGHAGVDFFFVLSGFIIMHAHAADIGKPERLYRLYVAPGHAHLSALLGRYPNPGDPGFFSADVAIRLAPSHIVHSILLLPEKRSHSSASAGHSDPRWFSTWCLPWPFSTGACASRSSLLR